ncbi:MAG: response regulator transcription factor, partial [Anaerolineae bacterium]
MIRVLLVDDKASIREEMRRLLELEEDIQVIGEAADGWEAIKRTRTLQPDLILMDKAMPSLDGIEATRLIKKDHPQARVIFLAAEETWRQEALQAGAEAYLLKDHGFDAVVRIIKKAVEPYPKERVERGFRLRGWLIEGFRRLWAQSPALTMGLLILLLVALSDIALLILPLSALELIARVLINYSLAAISLFFGVFFFAYALKYYASIALILLF